MTRDKVPEQLNAGDTWQIARTFAEYPAPAWTVTFYFENAVKQFAAVAVGSDATHTITIDAADTASYPPGRYKWAVKATDGSVVDTLESGWVDVAANMAAAGTRDHRSWARRALDAIQATIEGRASNDQLAMSVAGRSISRMTYEELAKMQQDLEARVRTEEAGTNAGRGRTIKVGFRRA